MDYLDLQEYYRQLKSGHFVKITGNCVGAFTAFILESDECDVLWTSQTHDTLENALETVHGVFGRNGEHL